MDQSAMTQARLVRSPGTPGSGGSLKLKVWFAKWLNVEMQCVPINMYIIASGHIYKMEFQQINRSGAVNVNANSAC